MICIFSIFCLGLLHLSSSYTHQKKIRDLQVLIVRQEESFKKAQIAAAKHYENIIREKEEVIVFLKEAIDRMSQNL